MRSGVRVAVLVVFPLLAGGMPLQAAEQLPPAAFQEVAERHGVPADLFYALARQESGRSLSGEHKPWSWTLNVAGQGHYFDSRVQACTALRQALLETSLVDVGIAQLNVRWNPDLFGPSGRFADPCQGLDPYDNLDAAAAILRAHFDESGSWLTAVGRYHRPAGGAAATRYALAVAARLPSPTGGSQAPSRHSILSQSAPAPAATRSSSTVWIEPVAMVWISPGG